MDSTPESGDRTGDAAPAPSAEEPTLEPGIEESRLEPPPRWRERLPELAIEMALIVFAVFLALAADQCREDRARARFADQARAKVLEEIGRNRAEIGRTLGDHEALQARLRAAGDATGGESGDTVSLDVIYAFAELSEAAWLAANSTQAVQSMDFDWVSRAAQVYQVQRLFDSRQHAFIDRLANLATIAADDPARIAEVLEGQLRLLIELERGLVAKYDEMLQGGASAGEDAEAGQDLESR